MESTIETRIKNYLALINKDLTAIETANPNLVDFVIASTLDRVMLYLNSTEIPAILERIIAEIVNGNLKQVLDIKANDGSERQVSSMSDNGQSISFSNEAKKYFASTSDDEIFNGYVAILNRYRRIKVVC